MSNLEQQMTALNDEVARMNAHWFMRSNASTGRMLWFTFLRGLAFGLGSVVGATILVSLLVYSLSSIDFVPVRGEWAAEVIRVIEGQRGTE